MVAPRSESVIWGRGDLTILPHPGRMLVGIGFVLLGHSAVERVNPQWLLAQTPREPRQAGALVVEFAEFELYARSDYRS